MGQISSYSLHNIMETKDRLKELIELDEEIVDAVLQKRIIDRHLEMSIRIKERWIDILLPLEWIAYVRDN